MRSTAVFLLSLLLAPVLGWADGPGPDPYLWPESQRAFLQDGPGLLLEKEEQDVLLALKETEREAWIEDYLARDPNPDTPRNELRDGIDRRRRLVRSELLSYLDDRARLLFLHGKPDGRQQVDCDQTFKPLEIWLYGPEEGGRRLIVYQPRPSAAYRLWIPIDSKRVLYGDEMLYWLEQWEELRGRIRGRRFDYQICTYAKLVDSITGVNGLFGYASDRPMNRELLAYLEAPGDLATWAREAAATPAGAETETELPVNEAIPVFFPEKQGQRMVVRLQVKLADVAKLEPYVEEEKSEYRLSVEGLVEHDGKIFEDFRIRYQVPVSEQEQAPSLIFERALRPDQSFLIRLKVRDEVGGREALVNRGFAVPLKPVPAPEPMMMDNVVMRLSDRLSQQRIPGKDSLILVPPETDVVLGLWRADALVTGIGIVKVVFLVDGVPQLTRRARPFTAELRLSKYPTEQVVRAEGYDAEEEVVASDELVINQQRGELRVSIVEPPRGGSQSGKLTAKAEIVVPEENRVEKVEFLVNDVLQATRARPPWHAEVDVPVAKGEEDITYLTVAAELDDGSRAEDVRFLNVPAYLERVDVDLVELFTTVTDRTGRLVKGLEARDFTVHEDGRPQEISKFELVENLPLTLGITVDTSGSMMESLGEARRAALDFLDNIMTPRDRAFAVSFSNHPILLMPRTSDVGAVAEALEDLKAVGATSLYDAVVTSLYYFRGVRGRRALILLSDGDDTASSIPYRDALEYARRSGVAIYTIGLDIGSFSFNARQKLNELAKETGGRSFYISKAVELTSVYDEIEDELRSQYLLAYTSDRLADNSDFRTIQVKVANRHTARTIRGYYP